MYGTNPPGEPTGEWAAFALIHLIVPLVLIRGDAELYIQARAYSLTLLMMLAVTLPYPPFLFFVGDWHNPLVAQILRFASLALASVVLIRSIRKSMAQSKARNLASLLAGTVGLLPGRADAQS